MKAIGAQSDRARRLRTDGRMVGSLWPPAVVSAVGLLVWQAMVTILKPSTVVLPSPADVSKTVWSSASLLTDNAIATAEEAYIAFALSVAIGLVIGVLAVKSRAFAWTIYPFVVGSQAVPKLALAPLFAVWLGVGMTSKIVLAILISFFPVAIGTAVGLNAVDRDAKQLARITGLGRLRTFVRIEFPAALPSFFGGLKVAVAFSVIGAVVGELVGSENGLGWLTLTASQTLNTPLLIATLCAAGVLGLASFGVIVLIERFAIPWRESAEAPSRVTA